MHAGVAQHKQGDLEAALQAFARASTDALSAAGLPEAALTSAADPASSAKPLGLQGLSTKKEREPASSSADSRPIYIASPHRELKTEEEPISSTGSNASVLAERTAVRALMAQASVLKQVGRLQDAMHALNAAAVLDSSVEVHRRQLRAELDSHDESLGPTESK